MKSFFGDNILLHSETAIALYNKVKDLPIIDYHCHLDQNKIKDDAKFTDIGELWLAGDHYKWRAMRLCGVDERYITGGASYHDKFIKYAEIVPQLIGNPLYYFTHLELKQIFGICEPLNGESAERIYEQANEKLKSLSVQDLLKQFKVEYIATTDDPCDSLEAHGKYGETIVAPTFRPDKLYSLNAEYLQKLGKVSGVEIKSLDDLLSAISKRLDYFVSNGCKITDHGFEKFPKRYATYEEAKQIFSTVILSGEKPPKNPIGEAEKDAFFGFLLVWLAKEYAKRNLVMQLHFAVIRNNNRTMYEQCGVDSRFDLIGEQQSVKDIVTFFNRVSDEDRPETVLYTLNDNNLSAIVCVTGAFRHVRMGAAWWFNDTLEGIKKNLQTVAEYSALGTHVKMTREESAEMYGDIPYEKFLEHKWRTDVVKVGTVPADYLTEISEGTWTKPIDCEVNKILFEGYDLILSVGQVVPHEVVGMSNHSKNILVGLGGSRFINASHMVGALYGMERMMGKDNTVTRKLFDYCIKHFLQDLPILWVLTVTTAPNGIIQTHGLFIGKDRKPLEDAIALSQIKNLDVVEKPIKKCVVYLTPKEFKSTWLGNKSVYRTRMAIADGGELLVLAPGIEKFGEDEGVDKLIRKYGYVGRERVLHLYQTEQDLKDNLSAAAHLIHGSSDGRFTITYAVKNITKEEIEGVNFRYADYDEAVKRYDPEKLKLGRNTLPDGEEIFFIPNPAL